MANTGEHDHCVTGTEHLREQEHRVVRGDPEATRNKDKSRRVDPAGRLEVEDFGEAYGYGSAATISRYSSLVKARSVSVDTLPAEPMARATFAAAASSGASLIATTS